MRGCGCVDVTKSSYINPPHHHYQYSTADLLCSVDNCSVKLLRSCQHCSVFSGTESIHATQCRLDRQTKRLLAPKK